MTISLRPMLLTSAPPLAAGHGWIHEAKPDGRLCLVEVSGESVQSWFGRGAAVSARLRKTQATNWTSE
jgi:hypothetical protein